MVLKDSDWWRESPDPNRLLRRASRSFDSTSSTCTQDFFVALEIFETCAILEKMVGAGNDQEREYVLGYSPDGRFEIVARPGKFFFLSILVNVDKV